MTCANCGHLTAPDDRFCERCGAPLVAANEPITGSAPVPGEQPAVLASDWHQVSDSTSRRWAVAAHLSALLGGFMGGVPAFLGPLIVWLARKDVDPFAATHARAAFNFNVSILLYSGILILLTVLTAGLGVLFTVPAGIVLGIVWLICSIRGAVQAGNDHLYRYPLTIPFVH